MQAFVAAISPSTGVIDSITGLNRIGSINGTGNSCKNFTLNVLAGDYVTSFAVQYNTSLLT